MTSLAAGFSSAVMPVSAGTVFTDTQGLEVGETTVAVRDGDMPAHYARPQGNGPHPHRAGGAGDFCVHEHIKDVCRRFAKAAICRGPGPLRSRRRYSTMSDINQNITQVVSKVPDEQVMQDLDATAA